MIAAFLDGQLDRNASLKLSAISLQFAWMLRRFACSLQEPILFNAPGVACKFLRAAALRAEAGCLGDGTVSARTTEYEGRNFLVAGPDLSIFDVPS